MKRLGFIASLLIFLGKRLSEAIPTLLIIITLTFFMVRLVPGGPFDREKSLSPEVLETLNAHYGLNDSLYIQYFRYLGNLFHGDLGPSFKYPGWTVNELIATKIPVSLELGAYAMLLSLTIGIAIGLIAALRAHTQSDFLLMTLAMAGICLPTFVIGPLLLLTFSLKLEWCNAMGWQFPRDRLLPALTLGIFYTAYIARLTRTSMLDVIHQDYIRTARAKGLPPWRIHLLHGLRNGILPIVSFLGPAFAGLISGSFVVETIFHIPGLGRFFITAALDNDYTLIMGCVIFYAALIITFNLFSDILLALLNPKIKFS